MGCLEGILCSLSNLTTNAMHPAGKHPSPPTLSGQPMSRMNALRDRSTARFSKELIGEWVCAGEGGYSEGVVSM